MNNISIYIHIPFCIKKCNYCNFYSVPYKSNLVNNYISCLKKEIENFSPSDEYCVNTIYFGGGTPSLLSFHHLFKIITAIKNEFTIAENPEVTLEANPVNITKTNAKNWKICGINRISLGAQSFNNSELEILGRLHSEKEIYSAVEIIKEYCTENVSMDLMYGIPFQSMKTWTSSLKEAIKLEPKHISSYCLTLEKGTYLSDKKDEYSFPDENMQSKMYEQMITVLEKNKFYQYEISNFSKKGFESKHNLNYWKGGEYLGFGASAHSFYKMKRINNFSDINKYIEELAHKNPPIEKSKQISHREFISDKIVLGLRLNKGISISEFRNKHNFDIEKEYKDVLKKFFESGYLTKQNDKLKLTSKALFVSNSILSDFV
ncbi:MAG: radical SAM family heme chaperone HemW [Candidatus Cloacimonetes bacterium]|nr:radical SAM family heme chaperone HemW [Candidatus Cloacimonadota bacterium]MBL7086258.1 radical SAM family heme chaperone HemW [Candidatus Cloacimonadota bacterium]